MGRRRPGVNLDGRQLVLVVKSGNWFVGTVDVQLHMDLPTTHAGDHSVNETATETDTDPIAWLQRSVLVLVHSILINPSDCL